MAHGQRDGCRHSHRRHAGRRVLLLGLLGMAGGAGIAVNEAVPQSFVSEINELAGLVIDSRVRGESFSRADPEITARFDHLLGRLLAHAEGGVDRGVLKQLLENPVSANTLSATLVDDAVRALLPVAVVRYLLATCGLSFIFGQAPQFERFVERYGTDILSVGATRFHTLAA